MVVNPRPPSRMTLVALSSLQRRSLHRRHRVLSARALYPKLIRPTQHPTNPRSGTPHIWYRIVLHGPRSRRVAAPRRNPALVSNSQPIRRLYAITLDGTSHGEAGRGSGRSSPVVTPRIDRPAVWGGNTIETPANV
jgi:hypothetical protein